MLHYVLRRKRLGPAQGPVRAQRLKRQRHASTSLSALVRLDVAVVVVVVGHEGVVATAEDSLSYD